MEGNPTRFLIYIMEEAAEVIQACSKVIRNPDDKEKQKHLEEEIGDLIGVIDGYINYGNSNIDVIDRKVLEVYNKYSKREEENKNVS